MYMQRGHAAWTCRMAKRMDMQHRDLDIQHEDMDIHHRGLDMSNVYIKEIFFVVAIVGSWYT
jgi:hypothetical protein